MGEISLPVLLSIILFLGFPFVGGYLAIRAKLPPIIGYIIGGLFLGIFLKSHASTDFLSHFAGIGIVLLLFTVGLETNIDNFKRFGRITIIGGLLQLFITAFFLFFLSSVFGFTFVESLFIGSAFAMSSTAVVAKIITDRCEENSLFGGLAMGMLIFQDLAAIPLIIVATAVGGHGSSWQILLNLVLGLFKSGGVLILLYFFGKKIVPILFAKTAKTSHELLNLFTIFFIFLVVYFFSFIGLSPAVAAFVSGILIGSTVEHHHIFSQIRPLRDLFAILFFVFLGASVNIMSILPQLPLILVFALCVILIKLLIVMCIFIFFKFHSRTSYSLGIALSQVGEFAFIILTLGARAQVIRPETYTFMLAVVLISIGVSPILFNYKDDAYTHIRKFIKKHLPPLFHYVSHIIDREPPHIEVMDIKNHVIICGYGRVGSYIGRALELSNIPYIAIDYNFYAVEKAKQQGVTIIYGDPTNIEILDYAQCETATCIVSAVPEKFAQEMIILHAKRLNPKITIISRVTREGDQVRLKDLGAEVVIQPEFEAAIAIIKKVLFARNVDRDEIIGRVKRLKIEHGMG